MSFSGTQYGDISPRVGIFAVANFLANAEPQLVLEKFAMVTDVPKNKGLAIKFRRPVVFDVSTVSLTEGVTPAPQVLEYEDVTVNLAQYGAWVPFTDVIADTHEDPNLRAMTEECGKQAASTKEAILWGVLRGGTSVIYSGTANSRGTVNAPLDEDDLRSSVRELKANHCKKITKRLSASPNIATEPVNAAYIAVGHTNLEADVRDLSGFVPVEKYSNFNPVSEHEIGKVEEIRIILTPHLEPFFGQGSGTTTGVLNNGANVDVYPLIVFGQDAYGVTPLKGGSSANIAVKNPKMGESYEDPLGQRGFVSWKMWFAAVRLNEQWMTRIECAASAL
jgi:N4-gp56 family major capsid protein